MSRRVHELLRIFHGIGDGFLRVIGGVGRLLRVEQGVEQITEVDQAVIHLLVPGQQILHHAAALDTVSDSAYGDAEVYLQRYLGEDYKAGFLRLVQEARSKTELPVSQHQLRGR